MRATTLAMTFLFATFFLLSGLTYALDLDKVEKLPSYDYQVKYEGPFKTNQLYNRTEINIIWTNIKRPDGLSNIQCPEAINTLKTIGFWLGNLSDRGECLGNAEAPEWTSGNYLNFLSFKRKLEKQKLNAH